MSNQPKKIVKSELASLVEAGKKRAELAEMYGLSEVAMAQVLKQAGLKIRKFHAPKWVLVDEQEETTQVAKNQLEIPFDETITVEEIEEIPVTQTAEISLPEPEVQELINDKIAEDVAVPSYLSDDLDEPTEEDSSTSFSIEEDDEDDFQL